MSLDLGYDKFYSGSGGRHPHQAIVVGRWPKNRIEAILCVPLFGSTILDIGCGDGKLLYQFREQFERLIREEYSSARLDVARNLMSGLPFEGICASAESMAQIESNSVDVIVSADVIEHIPDVYSACDEMFRVLRPGGSLILNTPNVTFIVKRLRLLVGRFPSTSQGNEGLGGDILFHGGHLHYFTFRSLLLLLRRSGFIVVGRTGFGPFGRMHGFWPELFSVGVQLMCLKPDR